MIVFSSGLFYKEICCLWEAMYPLLRMPDWSVRWVVGFGGCVCGRKPSTNTLRVRCDNHEPSANGRCANGSRFGVGGVVRAAGCGFRRACPCAIRLPKSLRLRKSCVSCKFKKVWRGVEQSLAHGFGRLGLAKDS